MSWTVSFDATGDSGEVLEDALEEFLDLLVDRGGAVNASSAGDRYGANFSVAEPVQNAAEAVAVGYDVFTALAEKAGLPTWPVVRTDAMTSDEQDRDLERSTFPELIGVSEVADILGVTRQRASALAKSPGFPDPVAILASGPVWTRSSLSRFIDEWPRREGRPPKLSTLTRQLLARIDAHAVPLARETRALLATPDEVIAEQPYRVLASLAQAFNHELTTMQVSGQPETDIDTVSRCLADTLRTMSGYSIALK
jgi:hypothetical protein